MTIVKPWFQTGVSSFSPASLLARLKNALKFEIPVGYEDETGFHVGKQPEEHETKWPATW